MLSFSLQPLVGSSEASLTQELDEEGVRVSLKVLEILGQMGKEEPDLPLTLRLEEEAFVVPAGQGGGSSWRGVE